MPFTWFSYQIFVHNSSKIINNKQYVWVKKCVEIRVMLFKNWKWLFENTNQTPHNCCCCQYTNFFFIRLCNLYLLRNTEKNSWSRHSKKAASYCRYPPNGVRGAAHPVVRASKYGIDEEYINKCEKELLIMCQVGFFFFFNK